jgi:pimeloyl-ACP methyl ester carboxylesterase
MKFFTALTIGFLCITALIYLLQKSLIFFPVKMGDSTLQAIKKEFPDAEEITIASADSTALRGWLVKPAVTGKVPLIIYFGGNAEEVSWLISEAQRFRGWAVCLMNYRGYGLSEGSPGERELYSDALAIYDYFAQRRDINRDRIIVMGRSIGSGVATYLAQNRTVKGAILICPFDSLVSIGKKHYPFLPVSLLLKHRFDSASRAPSIKIPLLALLAASDEIIPRESSMRLIEQWGGPHSVKIIEGSHNTLQEYAGYWESIEGFLAQY